MNPTIKEDVERYVGTLVGEPVALRMWEGAMWLPPYLREGYEFLEGDLLGKPVLWLFVRMDDEALEPPTPLMLEKHARALRDQWAGPIIFVFETLPAIARTRIIARGLSFVVPGVHTFLPDLFLEHRERERRVTAPRREKLRPSAQLLLLHLLGEPQEPTFTATHLAAVLDYSLMTLTRALEELTAAELVMLERRGRPSIYRLAAGRREVWEMAQPVLRDPVMRRERAGFALPQEPLAGLSALSEYTMLAAPSVEVRALPSKRARRLQADTESLRAETVGDERFEYEVWSYDPRTTARRGVVDRLSLYLTLRDDPDERVQMALDEMIGGIRW